MIVAKFFNTDTVSLLRFIISNSLNLHHLEQVVLEYRFKAFAEPCAIGHEQLWKIVREDIQDLPVPDGIDLRDLI